MVSPNQIILLTLPYSIIAFICTWFARHNTEISLSLSLRPLVFDYLFFFFTSERDRQI